MTHDEIIAVITAHKNGAEIESRSKTTRCYDSSWWVPDPAPSWSFRDRDYRVKPQPKLRPWKPEEVPVGAQIRNNMKTWVALIIGRNSTSVVTPVFNSYPDCGSFEEALKKYEHSTDGGVTWKPCGVLE